MFLKNNKTITNCHYSAYNRTVLISAMKSSMKAGVARRRQQEIVSFA
jgi:hypothetical protein